MTALLNRIVYVPQAFSVHLGTMFQLVERRRARHFAQLNQALLDHVKTIVEPHESVADIEKQEQRNGTWGDQQRDDLIVAHLPAFSTLTALKVKEPRDASGS